MSPIEAKYQELCRTPSDIFQHLPVLRQYAAQCVHITELGTRGMVSTWALLAGLTDRELPYGTLTTVDPIHPKDAGGNLEEIEAAARSAGVDFRFIQADDRKIEIEVTDLLFVDTWHVYEQLSLELQLHAGRTRKFIILHDTETYGERGETPPHGGLKAAVNEFLADKPWVVKEHFKNCNGLTVLVRKEVL